MDISKTHPSFHYVVSLGHLSYSPDFTYPNMWSLNSYPNPNFWFRVPSTNLAFTGPHLQVKGTIPHLFGHPSNLGAALELLFLSSLVTLPIPKRTS